MGPWRVVPTRKPHPTPSAPWRATLRQRHAIANKPATHTGTVPTCSRGLIPDAPAPAQTRVARCGTQLLPLRGQPRRPETPAPPPAPRALRTRRCHVCSGKNKSRLPHTTQPASRGAVARPHTPTPFSRTFVATVQGQGHVGKRPSRPCPSTTKMGHAAGPVSAHAALGDPDLAASRGGVRVVCPVPGRANAMRKTQPRRCPQGTDGAEPGPAATQLPTADPAPPPEKDKYRATSLKKRDLRTG